MPVTAFNPVVLGIGMPGVGELVIILLIVLVIFGAGKLPQIGDALGKSIRNFRKATKPDGEGGTEDPAVDTDRQLSAPNGQETGRVEDVEARDVTPSQKR